MTCLIVLTLVQPATSDIVPIGDSKDFTVKNYGYSIGGMPDLDQVSTHIKDNDFVIDGTVLILMLEAWCQCPE